MDECILKDNLEFRLILFVDLDHTLFDSIEGRRKSALNAIKVLYSGSMEIQKALTKYEKIVNHWMIFSLLGYPNFRIEWYRREIYEILLALADNEQFLWEMDNLERKILKIKKDEMDGRAKQELLKDLTGDFEKNGATIKFRNKLKYLVIDNEIQKKIDSAAKEFDRTPLRPIRGVRHFLNQLHKMNIKIYIITEGDGYTQTKKLNKTGLISQVDGAFVTENKTPEFYLQTVRSVAGCGPIKLAVFGDRYDKDIAPPIKIFGNKVITIRFIHGKYKHEYLELELEKKNLPKPNITVSTLVEATHLLTEKSTWAQADEINVRLLEAGDVCG